MANDHEPNHRVQFMKHERKNFDFESYRAYQTAPDEWICVFRRKRDNQERSDTSGILYTSFEAERVEDEHAFSPIQVYTSNDYKVILAYFKASQFILVHTLSEETTSTRSMLGVWTRNSGEVQTQKATGD